MALHRSTDVLSLKSKQKLALKKQRLIVKPANPKSKKKEPQVKHFIYWKLLAQKLRKSVFDNTAAKILLLWAKRLKRGIENICKIRRWKNDSVIAIQKNWKSFKCRKLFRRIIKAVVYIQRYWKKVKPLKEKLRKAKKIAIFTSRFAKNRYRKLVKSAKIIQKWFRGYKARLQYKHKIQENLQTSLHIKLKQRQQRLVKERNKRKTAVRKIEA
jgi:hypothetical protein